jgi:hypothetical protein
MNRDIRRRGIQVFLTLLVQALLLFVLRTALEDAALRRELDGYAACAEKVKYRLLPLIR